jgi:MFS family permease
MVGLLYAHDEGESAIEQSSLKGWLSGRTWAIPITFFLLFFGVGAVQPFIVKYVQSQLPTADSFQASLLVAAIYLAFGPCRFVASWVIVRVPRKWVIVLGALCYLALPASMRFGGSWWTFLAGCLVLAFGAGLIWTASSTRVLDQAKGGRYGAASGVLYFFVQCGIALGALALGALVPKAIAGVPADYTSFFRVSLTVGTLSVLCALMIPSDPAATGARKFAAPSLQFAWRFLTYGDNWIVPLILGVSYASYGILLTLITAFTSEKLGQGHVGWVSAGFYVSGILFSYIAPRLSDRLGRRSVLLAGFGGGAVAMTLMAFSDSAAGIGLATLLFGLPYGGIQGVAMAWVGDVTAPAERPVAHATTFLWRDLGGGSAALAVAFMQKWQWNYSQSFRAFALVFLVTAVIVAIGRRFAGPAPTAKAG